MRAMIVVGIELIITNRTIVVNLYRISVVVKMLT